MGIPSYFEADNIRDAITGARQSYVAPYGLKSYEAATAILKAEIDIIERKRSEGFDFVRQVSSGRVLLVGEGNLSFTRSLLNFSRINRANITTTTFEQGSGLTAEAQENALYLKRNGVSVLHGVNARKLSATFGGAKFKTIVFQFPNMGKRGSSEGHNPNYILVRDFLKSAAKYIPQNGRVLISAVDSPHYQGAFQFDLAAKRAGYLPPLVYAFDPKRFKRYDHTMTHQSGDALSAHREFKTWVFALK